MNAEYIVEKYNNDLESSNAFYLTPLDNARNVMMQNAPYSSYYLYVNEDDFGYIMNKGDKERSLPVKWIFVEKPGKAWITSSLFSNSIPLFTTFEWSLNLRWVNALTCWKKWFRIQGNDWFDQKLKSMCWSVYSIEDYIYSNLLESNKEISQQYLLNYPNELIKVYVNWKFYWMFLTVPNLNKKFLVHNSIAEIDESKQCIFKFLKDFSIDSPLLWNMALRSDFDSKQQLLWTVELNFWNPEFCMEKLEKLVRLVNQSDPNIDDMRELINLPSVLFWWLNLLLSSNELSFTHNYLLIYQNDKFMMWSWDAQEFMWCRRQSLDTYTLYNSPWYNNVFKNKLFSAVLQLYIKNDEKKIQEMYLKVKEVLCNKDVYNRIKREDLKYVLFDRFLRNLWHMRSIDYFWNDYISLLKDAYEQNIWFIEFFKRFYVWYDGYFWLDRW